MCDYEFYAVDAFSRSLAHFYNYYWKRRSALPIEFKLKIMCKHLLRALIITSYKKAIIAHATDTTTTTAWCEMPLPDQCITSKPMISLLFGNNRLIWPANRRLDRWTTSKYDRYCFNFRLQEDKLHRLRIITHNTGFWIPNSIAIANG